MRHAWVPFLTLNKKRIKIATLRILIEHIYSEDFKITVLSNIFLTFYFIDIGLKLLIHRRNWIYKKKTTTIP